MNTRTILTIGDVSILTTTPQACTILAQLDNVVFVAQAASGEYMDVTQDVMPRVELVKATDVLLSPALLEESENVR